MPLYRQKREEKAAVKEAAIIRSRSQTQRVGTDGIPLTIINEEIVIPKAIKWNTRDEQSTSEQSTSDEIINEILV